MNLAYNLRELRLLERNRAWLAGGHNLWLKLSYYPALFVTYIGILFGKKRVKYLGKVFQYDNVATPLNLQIYPYEITKKILKNMSVPPKTVLDIGGNIGQFSRTLLHFADSIEVVDIFEPNPVIFPLLERNLNPYSGRAKPYNVGLSTKKSAKGVIYYQPGKSATGSLLQENAGQIGELQKETISTVNHPADLTKRTEYDLVKIDVEGYEIEVIKTLENLKVSYLFIEVSSRTRKRNYVESDLFEAITNTLGSFELVYSNGFDGKSVAYELLIKFKSGI